MSRIVPPLFMRLVRRVLRRHYAWKGRFSSFDAVPAQGPSFESDEYARTDTTNLELLVGDRARIRAEIVNEHALLPLLAAIAARKTGRVGIIDFGGGLGSWFLQTVEGTVGRCEIDYYVVELPWAVREGSRRFATDRRLHFHTEWPDSMEHIDIVLLAGVLMYVADYREILERLARYKPDYILMLDLAAGSQPTFASAQRGMAPGSWIPFWFFNVEEIVRLVNKEGYTLVFRAAHSSHYDLSNFPSEYRLDHNRPCNLLFARQE